MNLVLAFVALLPTTVLDAGPLHVDVITSKAAQRFYVLDQLSRWNRFSHAQYRTRLGPFSDEDEVLLQKHAGVRKAHHGYGEIDTVFYAATDFSAALVDAVKRHALTSAEAEVERQVMTHFASRLDAFLDADAGAVEAAVAKLQSHRGDLAAFARRASHFAGRPRVSMPLVLIPSGGNGGGGGGANAGVLTVEVTENGNPYYTLVHESWHAFVAPHLDALGAAAKDTAGLDSELLSEGLAYAVMPGLYHTADDLVSKVRRDLAEGAARGDEQARRLAAFNRYALALRPLLAPALDDPHETLVRFLPRACDAFRVLASLDLVADAPRSSSFFFFGTKVDALQGRVLAKHANVWVRPHTSDGYAVLSNAHPKDVVVLLYTRAELPTAVPDAIRELLPAPIAEIRAALETGGSVEREATRRDWKIILLAAPDGAALAELAQRAKSFERALPR